VVLGVEPAEAMTFKPSDAVTIKPVGGSGEAIEGKIRVIAQRVDPATRLTSVIVTLPPAAPLMIEMFVQGELTRSVPDALVVPRDAVLPDEDGGFAVFTIDGDHAKKHSVRVGLENDREAQILSDDLKPGDAVVIRGNYHLEDGSEVKVAEADAATQPATSPVSAPAEAAK
jgi:membrane fusion protein (multidrug efflux system)